MSRRQRILLLVVLSVLIGLPLLLVGTVFIVANVDAGRRFIERTTQRLTGGKVTLAGLAGRFPDHLRLARLELKDAGGPWLQANEIQLDSSPLALIDREARVELLHAARVAILRAPHYASKSPPEHSSEQLWLHELRLDRLDLQRLELGAALAGEAVALQIQGDARAYSLKDASLHLVAQRLDAVPSTYEASAQIDSHHVEARLDLEEAAGGPLTHLAQVPNLGALAVHLKLDGPRNAVDTSLDLHTGVLTAAIKGKVDVGTGAADLAVDVDSLGLALRPQISWQRLSLHGTWHGPLNAPVTTARLEAMAIQAPDVQAKSVQAQLRGEAGKLLLDGRVGGLRLATPVLVVPDSKPLVLHAEARLGDRARPIDFAIANAMIDVRGRWNLTDIAGSASATLVDLKPFAAMAGLDLSGRGKLEVKFGDASTLPRLDIAAALDVNAGAAPIATLLRPHARLACTLLFRDQEVQFDNTSVDAADTHASMSGAILNGELNLRWKLAISRLTALSAQLAGDLSASGDIKGRSPNLNIDAQADGRLSAHGSPPGPLRLSVHLRDLPQHPNGALELAGELDGAPLELSANARTAEDGGVTANIVRGDWKSARAQGDIHLDSKAQHPHGRIELQMKQLSDLDRLLGQTLSGSIDASVELVPAGAGTDADGVAKVSVEAKDIGVPAQRVQHLLLSGDIDSPFAKPVLALQLNATALLNDRQGRLDAQARGSLDALELHVKSTLDALGDGEGISDAPVMLDSAATLDSSHSNIRLTQLKLDYRKQTLRLLSPSVISFGDGVAVDQLQLGSAGSELLLSGRVTPTLELRASLTNLTAAPLRALMPTLVVDGRIDAHAELAGSLSQPTGKVELHAKGLRAGGGAARGLPATSLDIDAQLAQQTAQVDAHLHAGQGLNLDVNGQVPLNSNAPMALKVDGAFDLSIFNPILEAGGQRAVGKARIDAQLDGSARAPQPRGTLSLVSVELQDYTRGARLTDLDATITADGDTLELKHFVAHAGPGTLSATGSVKLGDGDWPVDLKVTGRNAQPLASDLLTANVDLDLTLTGAARTQLNAAGRVDVNRAVVNIPNALPPDVETLNVVRAGQKPPPPAKVSPLKVVLDYKINAPRAVFVRGRGIDAELGGELRVRGTNADVDVSGGFEMRNGTVNLAGTTLTFTDGRVGFNGSGVKKKIDPTLDFTATNSTGGGASATLHVGGYADAPVISLSSVPEMPQDQILSQLLFGSSIAQLSTFQLAQIGAALASMGGVGGGSFNPINTVQRKLGLDRLSIAGGGSGSGASTTGGSNTLGSVPGAATENNAATIEAGRYVASRVYVGAKQSTAGPTQAQVQVDLTKKLKIQATLGTGGGSVQGATPQNDPGSSAGITYQFEY